MYEKQSQEHQVSTSDSAFSQNNLSSAVIVPTRNRLQDMLCFLDSIKVQTIKPDELIVVDSSDTKLTDHKEFLEKFSKNVFKDVKLIYEHTKPGLTLQRNIGASLVSSDLIYFFDDDTVLEPSYLEKMNETFVRFPRYAGGMGAVLGVPGKRRSIHRFVRRIFFLQRDNASGMFTLSGMPTHTYGTSKFKDVQVLGGCCMAYRSNVFKKHLFDEHLGRYSYMEDCDFSFRVSRTCRLFFNPEARLEHRHSPLARDKVEDNRAMFIKNYSYLFFKNFYLRNRLKVIAYVWSVLGLFVQAILIRNKAYIRGYFKGLKQYYLSSEDKSCT